MPRGSRCRALSALLACQASAKPSMISTRSECGDAMFVSNLPHARARAHALSSQAQRHKKDTEAKSTGGPGCPGRKIFGWRSGSPNHWTVIHALAGRCQDMFFQLGLGEEMIKLQWLQLPSTTAQHSALTTPDRSM